MMKAAVRENYGGPDVVRLKEVEKPIPKDKQVLVKVLAASLNMADWYQLKGPPSFFRLISGVGILKPKSQWLGSDLAGRVEAIGSGVT